MRLLKKLNNIFDRTIELSALVSQVITGFVVIIVSVDVSFRYFLNNPITGTIEISEYSLLFIVFLGAPLVLKRGKHARMDFVLEILKPRTRSIVIGINSFVCGAACGVITWYGVLTVLDHFQIGHRFSSSLELLSFPIMAVIPVGSFFLFIQFLIMGFGSLANPGASAIKEKETGEEIGV